MIGNQNIPKLRFPGFEGEWEEKKLGDVVSNKSGKFNPIKEKYFTKCIELEHLSTETGKLLGFVDGRNSGSIKNKFNEGDVLFGKLRPYLKKYLLAPFEGVCSSEIWVLKGTKISNSFLYQIVQTNKFIDLANQSSGSKMPRADWNVVENGIFQFPTLPEQQKIASFLSAVDEKIQQLSRKKELLEQYKKGVMQQLFSGKLRFKDENGKDYPDWEEKKLGDVGIFQTSSIDKLSKENELEVYLVNYMNVYRHEEINNNTIKHFQVVTAKENQIRSCDLRKGDILFTPSSETPTDIGHSVVIFEDIENAVYSYHLMRFRPKLKMDILYSHYFCNIPEVLNQLSKLATGSTRFTISVKSFSSIEVKLPCFNEQQKIANFLSSIDAKIENTKGELEKVQLFKKGLLQQLFV